MRMRGAEAGAAPKALATGLAMAAVYLFWGGTYLGMRLALTSMPPFLMAGSRFLAAGGALYLFRRARGDARPSLSQWKSAGVIGALLLLGGNGLTAWAEQTVPSSIASLVVATVPMWMAAIGHYTKETRLTPGEMVGLAAGFAGIGILVFTSKMDESQALDPTGLAALFLAAVLWASGSMYTRRAQLPASPLLSTAMQMISGGALLIVLSLATGDFRAFDPSKLSPRSIAGLAYLVVFGSIVAFSCYTWLLKRAEPTLVSTYAFVNPVVAMLLGCLAGGEKIGPGALAAAAVIIGAVALITLSRARTRRGGA